MHTCSGPECVVVRARSVVVWVDGHHRAQALKEAKYKGIAHVTVLKESSPPWILFLVVEGMRGQTESFVPSCRQSGDGAPSGLLEKNGRPGNASISQGFAVLSALVRSLCQPNARIIAASRSARCDGALPLRLFFFVSCARGWSHFLERSQWPKTHLLAAFALAEPSLGTRYWEELELIRGRSLCSQP